MLKYFRSFVLQGSVDQQDFYQNDNFQGSIESPSEENDFESKNQFIQLVVQLLPERHMLTICLRNCNEDDCVWLLQTLCRIDRSVSSRSHHVLKFKSCRLDEHFFLFLRDEYAPGSNLKLFFEGSCEFLTTMCLDDGMFQCLSTFAEIEIDTDVKTYTIKDASDINFKLNIRAPVSEDEGNGSYWKQFCKLVSGKDASSSSFQAKRTDDFRNPRFIMPWVIVKKNDDDQRYNICDSPWLFLLLRLPNVKCAILATSSLSADFSRRAFDEFCKRPSNCLPCDYRVGDMMQNSELALTVIDHLNATKMTRLTISLEEQHKDQVHELLTRAIVAISSSVHLQAFAFHRGEMLFYDEVLYFFRNLSNSVRLPILYDIMYSEQGETDGDESELVWYRRLFNYRSRDTSFRAFVLLVIAVTLGRDRMGPSCFLAMLNKDMIRSLIGFY